MLASMLKALYLKLYASSIECLEIAEDVESAIIKERLSYFLTKAFLIGEREFAYMNIEAGLLSTVHPAFIFRAVRTRSNNYSIYTIVFKPNRDGAHIPENYLIN